MKLIKKDPRAYMGKIIYQDISSFKYSEIYALLEKRKSLARRYIDNIGLGGDLLKMNDSKIQIQEINKKLEVLFDL